MASLRHTLIPSNEALGIFNIIGQSDRSRVYFDGACGGGEFVLAVAISYDRGGERRHDANRRHGKENF